ncbi:hypothetical protein HR45_11140 [Shewanella mangrovi]|uniref:Uncharacterized protein n=1 Tax=Shewanella mangrovi TaxID=1515746 RepID=A0A094JBC8_9GAMM|nr:hypothetical protein HR45_11140 [Shewanella mangrovi]
MLKSAYATSKHCFDQKIFDDLAQISANPLAFITVPEQAAAKAAQMDLLTQYLWYTCAIAIVGS